jgi:hypothetical protein
MFRKIRLLKLCTLMSTVVTPACAQLYYQDLLTHRINLSQHKVYKNNKVQHIRVTSFEANGEQAGDFRIERQYNVTWSQLKTVTEAPLSGRSVMVNFYNNNGQLYRTTDSSDASFTTYDYRYDSLLRLSEIVSQSNALGEKQKTTEVHRWHYDRKGTPEFMEKIKDGQDTTLYRFQSDSSGNVIEEQDFRGSLAGPKIYYYYDATNRITDIVKFNERVKKLLPDYLFSYDATGQLTEMVSVQDGGSDYLTWKYFYDEKGLKKSESCYNKQKQLVGKLEYTYDFKD